MSLTAPPPIVLSALAFPAMATMSCATQLPAASTLHTSGGGKSKKGRGVMRCTRIHTWLQQTDKDMRGFIHFCSGLTRERKACTQLVQEGCTDANIY